MKWWYRLSLGGALVASCHPPQASPRAVPPPSSAQHSACTQWPLDAGCVKRLAVTADMMCAEAPERWFCWGPGTTKFPDQSAGEGVVSLSSEQLTPQIVDDDARARAIPQPWDAPMWCQTGKKDPLIQCGHDTSASTLDANPSLGLPRGSPVAKVVAGVDYACALVDGRVWCFGPADRSQRGAPKAELLARPSNWLPPNHVELGNQVSSLVAKDDTTCAVAGGAVFCWGDGTYFPPGVLEPFEQVVVEVFTGFGSPRHAACLLTAGREVHCTHMGHFQHVAPLDDAEQLALFTDGRGDDELCARMASGDVRCVRLGGGEVTRRSFLEPAADLLPPYPCALTRGRLLRCDAHRLPDGEATQYDHLGTIVATSSDAHASCALNEAGEVACWRQVGWHHGTPDSPYAGASEDVAAPRVLPSRVKLVELSGSCARGEDGSVWRIGFMNNPPGNVNSLTLQLMTAEGARGAVRLDGCTAYDTQGPIFVLGPSNVNWNDRVLAERPKILPVGSDVDPWNVASDTFSDVRNTCVPIDTGGVECRTPHSNGARPARTYDPFIRSTRPLRVIPPPKAIGGR